MQHIYFSGQCRFFLHHHLNNSSLCSPSIPYFETSAVTGVEVDQAVTTLLGLVMKRMEHSAYGGPGPEPNGSPVASHEIEEAPVRRRCACWSRPRSSLYQPHFTGALPSDTVVWDATVLWGLTEVTISWQLPKAWSILHFKQCCYHSVNSLLIFSVYLFTAYKKKEGEEE